MKQLSMLAVALLVTSQAFAQSGMQETETPMPMKPAAGAVAESAEATTPLKAGMTAPAVADLKIPNGDTTSFAEIHDGKTTVVVFYRGGWCPYCTTQLGDLSRVESEIKGAGAQIIALSPDSATTLAGYLEDKNFSYTLVSDSTHAASKAFGVAFAVDAPTQERLKGFGIDLVEASGNPEQILPVPSVFVVNPEGIITFSHSDADYRTRLSSEDVLKAVQASTAEKM